MQNLEFYTGYILYFLYTSRYASRGLGTPKMISFQSMLRSAVSKKYPLGVALNFFIITLGSVLVPSPKIAINLPRTYEKPHCKREPYRFCGKQDPLVRRDIILLYL